MSDEDLIRRQRNRELVRNLLFVFFGIVLAVGAIRISVELFW